MEVKTVQRTMNQDGKVAYFVSKTKRVFTNLTDALNNAAQDIVNDNDYKTLSCPVAFKTTYGYIVKCINNSGKDRARKIFPILIENGSGYFNGVMLTAYGQE